MASAALRRLRPLLQRTAALQLRAMSTGGATVSGYEYETLVVSQPREWVTEVKLNRPEKRNAMNPAFWREILDCFRRLSVDSSCRVVLLTAEGKSFTAGLDLMEYAPKFATYQSTQGDVGRRAFAFQQMAGPMQDSFTAIEKCPKPVIACIHSACVGGGVDMVTACDIRLCSQDAWFQVKEVDIGIAADVGTLQRLPKIVGNHSWVRDIVYTARKVSADEALKFGLVSSVHPDREATLASALTLAEEVASKSPVAVQGSKVILNYSRDHTVDEGLNFAMVWNSAMIQSEDVNTAAMASIQKEKPVFSKL